MKQILTGNVLLIACTAFYLAWWCLAFKPVGAVKGLKSGWLLLPAAAFGVAAVLLLCKGIAQAEVPLFPPLSAAGVGALVYVILMAGSWLLLKRPVTSELFLIVGWAVLAICEASALFGLGVYGKPAAVAWILAILLLALISLACYLLYYKLDSVKGWLDGMVPLVIVALTSAATAVSVLVAGN